MEPQKIYRVGALCLTALIGILPVFMLTVGRASTIFYLIIAFALIVGFSRPCGFLAIFPDWFRYRWLAVCLFCLFFVVLSAMALEQTILGSALERSLRIAGGVFLVLGACLSFKPGLLRQATWGIGLSALISGAICWWLAMPNFVRPEVPQYNAVSYGNLLLIVTTITAFSLGWNLTPYPKTEKALKLVMTLAGLSGFILTQTRSGWIVTPFFVSIGIVLLKQKYNLKTVAALTFISFTALFTTFFANNNLATRAQLAVSEFKDCLKNPISYSSTCIRIQLWSGSWEMFKENPILGVRSENFNEKLKPLIERKIINQKVYEEGFGEPHNDLLYMLASYGALGFISLLLIYFAPAFIFVRRLVRNEAQELRVAAAMGLCICLGFFFSGFTETMFRGMRTMGFYAVIVAWLLALSDPVFLKRESHKS